MNRCAIRWAASMSIVAVLMPAQGGLSAGGSYSAACFVDLMKRDGEKLMSPYGEDRSGRAGASTGWHQGLDIVNGFTANPSNNPLYAGVAGKVTLRPAATSGGRKVIIRTDDGKENLIYMHLDHLATGLDDGGRVKPGQTVGYMGATGVSSGAVHLHFGLSASGDSVSSMGGTSRVFATGGCPWCGTKSVGGGSLLTADAIAKGLSASKWYFVNPEPFLSHQIPTGDVPKRYPSYAKSHASSPGMTFPNTCTATVTTQGDSPPASTSDGGISKADATSGGVKSGSADLPIRQTAQAPRALYAELSRTSAENLAVTTGDMAVNAQTDSVLAHLMLIEAAKR